MPATLQFGFRSGPARRRREDEPAWMLLMGDFSARAGRGLADATGLASRRVHEVDVDTLDTVMERLGPAFAPSTPGEPGLQFQALEDFHPDRLLQRHAGLKRLLDRRRRLLDPRQFAEAARECAAVSAEAAAAGSAKAAARPVAAPVPAEDDHALLGRLLGGGAAPKAPTAPPPLSGIDALLRQAVSAQDLAPELPFQSQYIAAVDAALATGLRMQLHDPAWQSLEAAWRSVHLLVSQLTLGEDLKLFVFDVTTDELQQGGAALAERFRTLAQTAADAGAQWTAVGLLHSFGATPHDLALLEILGLASAGLGAPLVAGALPDLAGLDVRGEWTPLEPGAQARWQALRRSPASAWLALAAPRLLMRLPHGPKRDPIDSLDFDELSGPVPRPHELLWGEPAPAVLRLLGLNSTGDGGEEAHLLSDLPALSYTEDGERCLQPGTACVLSDRAAGLLLAHGVMPIQGSRHRHAARLLTWQTVAAGA